MTGWLEGTGVHLEATADRQLSAQTRLRARYTESIRTHTHLWNVVVQHFISDEALRGIEHGDAPLLDLETLAGVPAIGCYICEQLYEPRLLRSRCRGEPSG